MRAVIKSFEGLGRDEPETYMSPDLRDDSFWLRMLVGPPEPLGRAHRVPLDELVGAPPAGDPRVHLTPRTLHGMTVVPLSQQPGPLQAFKMVLPAGPSKQTPNPQTHEGYEWLYVLSGRLRMVLAEHDVVLGRGEAAEGERLHLRTRPRPA